MCRAFANSGFGLPSTSGAFQPVWSKCRCVNATASISEAGAPASASTSGSAAGSFSGSIIGRGPIPVSTRIVFPWLAITQQPKFRTMFPSSSNSSAYCSQSLSRVLLKNPVGGTAVHESCTEIISTSPTRTLWNRPMPPS